MQTTEDFETLRLPDEFDPINFEIMNKMDDATLLAYCIVDQRALTLCNNQVFWRNRVLAKYGLLIKYKEIAETWYEFYRRIYYDAYYLLRVDGVNYLYTNIVSAYNKLVQSLWLSEGLPVENLTFEQLSKFDFGSYEFLEGNHYQILIIFKNRAIITGADENNSIFRLSEVGDNNYFDANLLSYPILSPSGPLINLISHGNYENYDQEETDNVFFSLSSEDLMSLRDIMSPRDTVFLHDISDDQSAYIVMPDSDKQGDKLGYSQYGLIMTRENVVLALLNPALYDPRFESEFFVFVATRDYHRNKRNEAQQTLQLITTPGAAHQLRDISALLTYYPPY
jgi:hypothetical protein